MKIHYFENQISNERYKAFLEECLQGKENKETGEISHLHLSENASISYKYGWITLSLSFKNSSLEIDLPFKEFLLEYSSIDKFYEVFNSKVKELVYEIYGELNKNSV
jgi:hypothetical protein